MGFFLFWQLLGHSKLLCSISPSQGDTVSSAMHLSEDLERLENGENPDNCLLFLLRGTSRYFVLIVADR